MVVNYTVHKCTKNIIERVKIGNKLIQPKAAVLHKDMPKCNIYGGSCIFKTAHSAKKDVILN